MNTFITYPVMLQKESVLLVGSNASFPEVPFVRFTLIYPHFTCCSTVWSSTKESNVNNLVLLQKRAVQHICHSGPRDHTGPLFKMLDLLKLKDIINLG